MIYSSLLNEWTDGLLRYQLTHDDPCLDGGIICPACSRIHGRCPDAIYALMSRAHTTGNSRYLDASLRLYKWWHNVDSPDGAWFNDVAVSLWRGITVFGSIALAESLKHHADILDSAQKQEWTDRLSNAAEFIYSTFSYEARTNINYPVTASYALALCGEVLDKKNYRDRGREFAHKALPYFTKNNLLAGEGWPFDRLSDAGCLPVDIGYNVEESLPALTQYGILTNDEEVLGSVTEALKAHLMFMLPDGGWDNSFATRSYKWTYWGSRTSDGCQPALLLLADRDPSFAEAALRNTRLLKACTSNGLLYGGPHYMSHAIPPCIHHTFAHVKPLAFIADTFGENVPVSKQGTALPVETLEGCREYSEIKTVLIGKGRMRATVTAYDWMYANSRHASGGALTLLYHAVAGPLLVASQNVYELIEDVNMQVDVEPVPMPLTPRIVYEAHSKVYTNIEFLKAVINSENDKNVCRVTIKTELVDDKAQSPKNGSIPLVITYAIESERIAISIHIRPSFPIETLTLFLPVISRGTELFTCDNRGAVVNKQNSSVVLSTDGQLALPAMPLSRVFNHVPGMEAIPFYIKWNPQEQAELLCVLEVKSI